MDQVLSMLNTQDMMTVGIIVALLFIFMVFMVVIKKIVAGIITVVVAVVVLVGGSWYLFNQGVDNIAVVNNALVVDLPFIETFSLPLDNVNQIVVTELEDSYMIGVIRGGGQRDLLVEVPAAVFLIPGAVDRIEEALLAIPELAEFHNDIRQGAKVLNQKK